MNINKTILSVILGIVCFGFIPKINSQSLETPWPPLRNIPGGMIYDRPFWEQWALPVITYPYWLPPTGVGQKVTLNSINIYRKYEYEKTTSNRLGEREEKKTTEIRNWNGNNTNTLGISGNTWTKMITTWTITHTSIGAPGAIERKSYSLTRRFYASTSNPNVITSAKENEESVYWTTPPGTVSTQETITDPWLLDYYMDEAMDDMDWIGFKLSVSSSPILNYREEEEIANTGVWRVIHNPGSQGLNSGWAFVDTSPNGPWFWGATEKILPANTTTTFDITVGYPNNRRGGLESIAPLRAANGSWEWTSYGSPLVYYNKFSP